MAAPIRISDVCNSASRVPGITDRVARSRIDLVRLAEGPMVIRIVHALRRIDSDGDARIDPVVIIDAAISAMDLGRLAAVVRARDRFGHDAAPIPDVAWGAGAIVLFLERDDCVSQACEVAQLAELITTARKRRIRRLRGPTEVKGPPPVQRGLFPA